MFCNKLLRVTQQVDWNLLAALDVLLTEGSVTGAAERLHLSVPATSRTLGRIRHAFGDPILVRAGRGLVPTPRALAIQERLHQLVEDAHALLETGRDLDLARLQLRCVSSPRGRRIWPRSATGWSTSTSASSATSVPRSARTPFLLNG